MELIIDEPEELNTGAKIYPKDILNHVILVWAVDYIKHSPTAYNDGSDPNKPCDVVVVDAVDLDQLDEEGTGLGLVSHGSWWRQGRLIQRLKPRVGRPNPLIGRMTKGVGPNGAFELTDLSADPKAVARARAWWADHPGFAPHFPGQRPPLTPEQMAAAPTPGPPSPLEDAANRSLGRPTTPAEDGALDRLRRIAEKAGGFEDTPPF